MLLLAHPMLLYITVHLILIYRIIMISFYILLYIIVMISFYLTPWCPIPSVVADLKVSEFTTPSVATAPVVSEF